MNNLKRRTASGFVYRFAERLGAQGVNFIVQLILARLLVPDEYGLIAIVTVFISICDVLVTYGFGNSLIVNEKSDTKDFSTCFYFGLCLSIIVYAALYFSAPVIGRFYKNDLLITVLRVMGLCIPITAVNSVQHAFVKKHMMYKKFFISTSVGTVVSGVIAIVMACHGLGVWSLVEQYLGNVICDTICLAIVVRWRPTREFSLTRLKKIYDYGWKILFVGLIDTTYSRLRNLIIGKKYTSSDLAYYNRGHQFPLFIMHIIEPTVNTVLFPALSQCRHDRKQMKEITREVIMASVFINSPVMIGLAVVAKPLVVVLLTEKWLPCVAYLQIGCLANLFRPNQFINSCVIQASGDSALLLRLDIIKKSIGLIILLISMKFGVFWIALSLVIVYFISMTINIAPNRKILGYGYREQCKDFIVNIIPALIMGVCIYPISLLNMRPVITLVIQIFSGILIYFVLAVVTKNNNLMVCKRIINQIISKK